MQGLGIIYFPRCRGGREGKVPPLLLLRLPRRRRPLLPLLALRARLRCCRCGDSSCEVSFAAHPLSASGSLPPPCFCPCSCVPAPASAPVSTPGSQTLPPPLPRPLSLTLVTALTPESLPLLPSCFHAPVPWTQPSSPCFCPSVHPFAPSLSCPALSLLSFCSVCPCPSISAPVHLSQSLSFRPYPSALAPAPLSLSLPQP